MGVVFGGHSEGPDMSSAKTVRLGGWGVWAGLAVATAGLAIDCRSAWAQQDATRRIERAVREATEDYRLRVDPTLSLEERTQFEVGGFTSLTGVWLDDSADNSRRLIQWDTNLFARASLDGVHNGFIRVRFPFREFSPGDSFDGRGDDWVDPFLDRYIYEFDLRRAIEVNDGRTSEHNFNLRVGRQFVDWGAGLALSETLLSVRPTFTFYDRFRIEGLVGVTPNTTVDFDASRSEFDRRTRRGYFGIRFVFTTEKSAEYYAFGLRMQDYNTDSNLRTPAGPVATANFKYSSTYFGLGSTGSLTSDITYLGELVWQAGKSQSDPLVAAQSEEDISAFAGRAQTSYLFRDERQTRLQLEGLFATGDSDRLSSTDTVNGNFPGTKDTAFNSLGFANLGLAFSPSFSNIYAIRAGGSTFPLRNDEWFHDLQIGLDFLVFGKMDKFGGIDETTGVDGFLGSEIDLSANYRITSDLAVNARYGVFFPGDAITGPKAARHFILLGVTLSF